MTLIEHSKSKMLESKGITLSRKQ